MKIEFHYLFFPTREILSPASSVLKIEVFTNAFSYEDTDCWIEESKDSLGLLPSASCYIVIISTSVGWVIKSLTFVSILWWLLLLLLKRSAQ